MMSNTLATSETTCLFVMIESGNNSEMEFIFRDVPLEAKGFSELAGFRDSLSVVSVSESLRNLLKYRWVIEISFPECEPTAREKVCQLSLQD